MTTSPSQVEAARWVRVVLTGHDLASAYGALAPLGADGVAAILDARAGPWPPDRVARDIDADLTGALTAIADVDPRPLIDALEQRPDAANAIVWALGCSTHPDTVDPLLVALEHRDASVRWAAAVGLQRTRPPRALDPLLKRLRDRSSNVRRAVLQAVAGYDDSRIVPALKAYRERYNLLLGEEKTITEAIARFADDDA